MRIADRVLLGDVKLPPTAVARDGTVKWDSSEIPRYDAPGDYTWVPAPDLPDNPDALKAMLSELRGERREVHRDLKDVERRIQTILAEAITGSTVVRADNVYRYLADLNRAIDPYDIPSFAPAFEAVSMEWTQANAVGVLVAGQCLPGPFEPDRPVDGEPTENGYRPTGNGLWRSNNLPGTDAWKSVKWLWQLSVFIALPGDSVYGPLARVQIALADTGRALDITRDHFIPDDDTAMVEPGERSSQSALEALVHSVVLVFGHAMTFLGCRNVATAWYDPPEGLQRKHRRKRGATHPLVRYHVIEVRPATGERARSREGTDNGDLRALHPVRGHFSHFGNCCPGSHPPHGKLFGKYEGRVFMPPHARGNREAGVVAAEYNVHAPTTETAR